MYGNFILSKLFWATPLLLGALACRDRGTPAQPAYPPGGYPPGYPRPSYPPPGYPQQGYPPQPQPPPVQPPATAAPAPPAAWPFPIPPGFVLPPVPAGWVIPGFPWPQPAPTTSPPPGGTAAAPAGLATPDALGIELADRINAYRQSRGLPPIPRSRSLGIVAATHVRDQETNHPDTGSCNQHSWTPTASWSGCCYTADHAQAQCMWKKPSELTSYRGSGYEISTRTTGTMTPAQAVDSWRGSPGHHAVMINGDSWANNTWRAMGTAVGRQYAVAWFGEEVDPAGGF